ncbi:MAG: sigma-70 family RNA polymerase sigma factor [Deltaproteobacteria bacterium]|nr:sigma-70 family RNA polymerase sigma factor [Deltaproteobacteria bacterium]
MSINELYRTHGPSVHRRARELLGNDNDAREMVQEIFLSLLNDPKQFKGRSTFSTWLYSATTHRCLNRLRDQRTRARLIGEELQVGEAAAETGRSEAVALLRQTLARMPAELAVVAVHYYLDEMSHEEIARIVGCSRRHIGDLLVRLQEWAQRDAEASCRSS